MITLYHGSNVFIEKIDLTRSHPDKDFGKGYYLTDIRTQAEAMSIAEYVLQVKVNQH